MDKDKLHSLIKEKINRNHFHNAAGLVSAGKILFCSYIGGNNIVYTVMSSKNNSLTRIKLRSVEHKLYREKSKISIEEIAALVHYIKFNDGEDCFIKSKKKPKTQQEITKHENANRENLDAQLIIYVKDSFPNASSIWEKCSITLKILAKNKEYTGNVNKLRQIRYNEDKSTSDITIQNFNSQSRQIIRFITQYAEPNGDGYSLKSDQMADLFHCLIGFDNFYCKNQNIIVHSAKVELVIISDKPKNNTASPAIKIGEKILILASPDIILGRGGMWIGMCGEYWWIDGIVDLIWLRNFILSDNQSLDSVRKHINNEVELEKQVKNTINCVAIYFFDYSDKIGLILRIKFRYNNQEFYPSEDRFMPTDHGFIKRDKNVENSAIISILKLGFIESTDENKLPIFVLQDDEGIGLFLESAIIDKFINSSIQVYLSPIAAVLTTSKIKQIELTAKHLLEDSGHLFCNLKCEAGEVSFRWKEIVRAVKENRRFIVKKSKVFTIPTDLSSFISKVSDIVSIQSRKAGEAICIAKNSVIFWCKAAKNIPSLIPVTWKNFSNKIQDSKTIVREINSEQTSKFTIYGLSGTLRRYQTEAVKWMEKMINNDCNFILADEMGLGKTVQTLALIQRCHEKIASFRSTLVICPTSLVNNWEEEAKRFVPTLSVITITGTNRKSWFNKIVNNNLIITSYAAIKKDIIYYESIEFDLLVLDEAQHIKNPETINARTCKQIKTKHRMILTGTPIENTPQDIWSIFDFLSHGTLGNKENFKRNYMNIENDDSKQNELAERISPFILRRHKNEVEQLPNKTEQILFCEMTPEQQKIYNKILFKGKLECDSYLKGKSTRFNVLTVLLKLRQICCHPGLISESLSKATNISAKTDLLQELIFQIIDGKHKALIFSQFTSLLSIIKKWCIARKIPFEYLDGQSKNRQAIVQNFNSKENISIFLLSLKAGGTGFNLTSANTVIIYDPWWNPSVESQATDRTHRIGQKNPVNTIKLVMKNSIEEKVLDLQKRKQFMFDRVIENSSSFRKLSDKDLAYLLDYNRV